ncbi:MAG: hypothetical protein QXR76_03280 [Candidatus Bathyarchaeia archaeon]
MSNGVDYMTVFLLSFGTGVGTALGTEFVKVLLSVVKEKTRG